MKRLFGVVAFVAALLVVDSAPNASDRTSIRYKVSLGNLSVGTAGLDLAVNATSYSAAFAGRVTGIANLFSNARAEATANGRIGSRYLVPASFNASVNAGRERRTVGIRYGGGNISSLSVNPPFPPDDDRIPVTSSHQRNVTDPVSGLVVPAPSRFTSSAACNATLPIFDGRSRYDIVLSPARMEILTIGGVQIQAAVCNVSFRPIAGVRESVRNGRSRPAQVWLARTIDGRLLAPAQFVGQSRVGTFRILADSGDAFIAGQ
ncbi:MAG: DUF3108 domain-containing protein [Pseudomonadota bacterium]